MAQKELLLQEGGIQKITHRRADLENLDFIQVDTNYGDKGGHKERSLVNQPNHINHWKKERRK
jgi:hypothetical protein